MRAKALSRMLFVIGVITWIALLFTDLSVVFSAKNNLPQEVPTWLPGIILNLYLITLYYYYKFKIDRDEQLNFVDLLWRVFATGLIATVL
ncbi:MAG TPA: serine/threonine protein phosphatase, partial [Cyclobacteriaceae bacterium]|nr:serine/threonine protein phosphatase [Cyclobacteriaceae bacterium]